MRLIDARRLDWHESKAKGKKHFILMRGIIPFVVADLLSFAVYALLDKLFYGQITLYSPILYTIILITSLLFGYFYSNRIWNSNVKNFDK